MPFDKRFRRQATLACQRRRDRGQKAPARVGRAAAWLLLTAFLGTGLATARAAPADSTRRQEMADAMLKMMDYMGFTAGGDDSASRGWADFRGGDRGWAPWAGTMDKTPWGSTPWGGSPMERLRPWSRLPWGLLHPGDRSQLDGTWVSLSGERLTVVGAYFRLDAGPGRVAQGLLRMNGNRLLLYQPQLHRAWRYEYAEEDGRLVLRGDEGQLFLYRRVPATGR